MAKKSNARNNLSLSKECLESDRYKIDQVPSPKNNFKEIGGLTIFDMFFFLTVIYGGGGAEGPHHNFVVIAPMIMKFDTGIKLYVFYTMVTKYL